jgi:hypothetical protein
VDCGTPKTDIFNLTRIGAIIPMYLVTTDFEVREYAAKGDLIPVGDIARSCDTP